MPVDEVQQKDNGYYGSIMGNDITLKTKYMITKIRLREQGKMLNN